MTLTTRSEAGVPTAGASVEDLRNLRPVGGATQLHPFETVSPSTFRTTFVARKTGPAGIALSFMGLTLYATTTAVSAADEFDAFKTTITCCLQDHSVDMPLDVIITARDRWGAPFPCRSESMWSLAAPTSSVEIMSLTKTSCSTLRARLRPLRSGPLTVELMHCSNPVGNLSLNVQPRQTWDPQNTRMTLKKDTGDDVPVSFLLSTDDALNSVGHLDTVLLVISTHAPSGMLAIGPAPDALSVVSLDSTPVVQVSEGVYVTQIYGFEPGLQNVEVDIDGTRVTMAVTVRQCARVADPRYTQAECRPTAAVVGDTVSALISFYDSDRSPAEAPDPSHLLLEPIGNISKLTRVAPQGTRASSCAGSSLHCRGGRACRCGCAPRQQLSLVHNNCVFAGVPDIGDVPHRCNRRGADTTARPPRTPGAVPHHATRLPLRPTARHPRRLTARRPAATRQHFEGVVEGAPCPRHLWHVGHFIYSWHAPRPHRCRGRGERPPHRSHDSCGG